MGNLGKMFEWIASKWDDFRKRCIATYSCGCRKLDLLFMKRPWPNQGTLKQWTLLFVRPSINCKRYWWNIICNLWDLLIERYTTYNYNIKSITMYIFIWKYNVFQNKKFLCWFFTYAISDEFLTNRWLCVTISVEL